MDSFWIDACEESLHAVDARYASVTFRSAPASQSGLMRTPHPGPVGHHGGAVLHFQHGFEHGARLPRNRRVVLDRELDFAGLRECGEQLQTDVDEASGSGTVPMSLLPSLVCKLNITVDDTTLGHENDAHTLV